MYDILLLKLRMYDILLLTLRIYYIGTVTARGRRSERSYEVGVDTGTSPAVT